MIEIQHLTKTFPVKEGALTALHDINLTIENGDIFGIIGMSGAGKSTLVRCINMLERPTAGKVLVGGQDMGAMTPAQLREARRSITMIFQQFGLLMQRTCLSNVCFPMEISGVRRPAARKRAMELLELVGLPDKARAYPAQLSGGQKQRVAIARALATKPQVLLCDEATSALDPSTTHAILELVRDINQKMGITVVVITHQMSVVEEICRHVAILDGGEIAEQGEVAEIFSNPQSDAAKLLVYPAEGLSRKGLTPGAHLVRVAFGGSASTDRPLVASLAMDTGVLLSVISADTSNLGGQIYGNMLLGLPQDEAEAQKALDYMHTFPGITVEEVQI